MIAYLAAQTLGTAIGLGIQSLMLTLTGSVLAAINFMA